MPVTASPSSVRAANRLRALREAAGLSRTAVLARLAADPMCPIVRSEKWLSSVEKAQVTFPWGYVEPLARALGVEPGEILWVPPHPAERARHR